MKRALLVLALCCAAWRCDAPEPDVRPPPVRAQTEPRRDAGPAVGVSPSTGMPVVGTENGLGVGMDGGLYVMPGGVPIPLGGF